MSFIKKLLQRKDSRQTVFTVAELTNLVPGYTGMKLKSALKYAVNKKDLTRLSRGIYAVSADFSREELGNKYRRPSYISFYTVLSREGIVFQPYTSIFLAANRSQTVNLTGQKFIYRKIKPAILLNPLGITANGSISQAAAERAIADTIYIDGAQHLDNISQIKWDYLEKINAEVYQNNRAIAAFIKANKP